MKQIRYLTILFFLTVGCDKNVDSIVECKESGNCDKCIIINKNLYNQTNTDNYTIQNITVNQDCLEIEFSSSGCNGNSWEIDLFDLGAISETAVPQRELKLKLINHELCEAFITSTISFYLEPLQLDNNEEINLKIADYQGLIRYEY